MSGTTAILFLALCICGAFASPTFDGRIVGGKTAYEGQYPYQVSLQWRGSHFCGGSIINNQWILTAGHCLDTPDSNIRVITGTNSWKYGDVHQVEVAIAHPQYSRRGILNDIALIKIRGTIEFDDNTQPIQLPTSLKSSGRPNALAVVSGWGVLDGESRIPASDLMFLKTRVIDYANCRPNDPKVCTLLETGRGACFGDSGGPLVSNGIQIGIASYVMGGCAAGNPDVFTRVYSHLPWIKSTINDYSEDY